MRSAAQAGALDDGSFPFSDATEEGDIQPYDTSDQLCIQERGVKSLPDCSRQLARALEACDSIKIIALMPNHKCHEDVEGCAGLLCSPRPRRLGIRRATGKQLNIADQSLRV